MDKPQVMVVEDEFVIAVDIQKALERIGYDVPAIESSGEDAIKTAGEIKPDLVLMDIMLNTEMDGIKAARQICSQFNIPVVYLSAFSNKEILEEAKLTEPHGFLVKPFNEKELRSTLEMILYKDKMEKKRQKLQDEIKVLRGILTICAHCKKIRDKKGFWKNVADYIRDHSEAEFTHSICPECLEFFFHNSDEDE